MIKFSNREEVESWLRDKPQAVAAVLAARAALRVVPTLAPALGPRGMRGIYQHCAEKHLHRYLAEYDFRYNTRKMTTQFRASGRGEQSLCAYAATTTFIACSLLARIP